MPRLSTRKGYERWRCAWLPAAAVFLSLLSVVPAAETNWLAIRVLPASAGQQVVRASIPFPKGFLKEGGGVVVGDGSKQIAGDALPLTTYPAELGTPRSVRRALVTFPYRFSGTNPVELALHPAAVAQHEGAPQTRIMLRDRGLDITLPGGPVIWASLICPERKTNGPPRIETVEQNRNFFWQRAHIPDPQWPRMIEVRVDSAGTVVVVAHVQNLQPGNVRAPDLGWEISSDVAAEAVETAEGRVDLSGKPYSLKLSDYAPPKLICGGGQYRIYHPVAGLKRRGICEVRPLGRGFAYRYLRATKEEKVPMQQAVWQRAEFVIAPVEQAQLTATLQYPHQVIADWKLWDELYRTGPPLELKGERLIEELAAYHRQAIRRSMVVGDDMGNITSFSDGRENGSVYGMNRLNHCPPIFEESYRANDQHLLEAALLWCENFVDQSIWWGPGKTGGTRYNNIIAQNQRLPDDDRSYMWRSDDSVHFCTKGYDSFFLAYEEAGDPRFKEALEAQLNYAVENIRATVETRNVGDVRDFLRLYGYTGDPEHLKEALRLFEDYRSRLSAGDLTSQGGQPIEPNPPFIDEDEVGMKHPFPKPYIIGYALAGLPELLKLRPEEPKLKDVVCATADFLAESQDPLGGWRYPHPRSSWLILAQAMEHAWQIVQADLALGADEKHLDAIERVLRQRILGYKRTGRILSGLEGWEMSTGKVKKRAELYALYRYPVDRDFYRDYREGNVGLGESPPEGLVYFFDVLRYYLKHRKAGDLLMEPKADQPLGQVLGRTPEKRGEAGGNGVIASVTQSGQQSLVTNDLTDRGSARVGSRLADANSAIQQAESLRDVGAFQSPGVANDLPAFREKALERLTFPLSWTSGRFGDFEDWRRAAKAKVIAWLLPPPPAMPFEPVVTAEEDRASYVARKVVFNLTGDSRVLGLMTVPKGAGPYPAVLLLHDHGAKFDIGKEKVIRPWADTAAQLRSAQEWVEKYYGGRFLGDELAQRGYVCLATDMLNWSDRGGGGYDGQQALAANLLQLGSSFAGTIAHEDLRAAEFLASRPEVDRRRVGAMGLSVGGFRTWQVTALSDHIAAGVSVCWMATVKGLMVPMNNQTRGQSAFTMVHPGLDNFLDYPDVASIACPKPLMFLCGRQDKLFPTASIEEAFAKMRLVWDSQRAGAHLEARLYDAPHEYNRQMQDDAFAWLDRQLKPK